MMLELLEEECFLFRESSEFCYVGQCGLVGVSLFLVDSEA